MSKKAKQIVAGTLGLLLVGGTLAAFTSTDSITNKFTAGGNGSGDPNAGIVVEEKFNGNDEFKTEDGEIGIVTPGQEIQKEVRVNSNVNYTQFVKANLTLKFYNKEVEITDEAKIQELAKNIKINYINVIKDQNQVGNNKWIQMGNNIGDTVNDKTVTTSGTYYYNTVLAADGAENNADITSSIINRVDLLLAAGNEFKDITFKVVINAESIQATDGAINNWTNAPNAIKDLNTSTK